MRQIRKATPPEIKRLTVQENLRTILGEMSPLLQSLNDETVESFLASLRNSRAVFFSAQGRAGYILRCFCMRLMHLGYQVYFCGDTNTPAITSDDLLVVLSGSGETPWTLEAVKSAKRQNARAYGILGNLDSRIGSLVNEWIHLPGTTKLRRDCEPFSAQLGGSLFEQSAFLFLEAIVLGLYQEKAEEIADSLGKHAVIE